MISRFEIEPIRSVCLRDHFAAQAMNAMLTAAGKDGYPIKDFHKLALISYEIADAMVVESEQTVKHRKNLRKAIDRLGPQILKHRRKNGGQSL